MNDFMQKIKQFFYQRYLKKKLSRKKSAKKVKKPVNFDTANKIGILFDATDLKTRKTILDYVESLKDQKKRVKLLGYFDNRLKDNNFTFKHFNKDNIDWAMRPKGEHVENFLDQDFDLFINLSPVSSTPAEFISAVTNAELKVGPYTENTFCYDLMIEPRKDVKMEDFIKEVEILLKKTNTT